MAFASTYLYRVVKGGGWRAWKVRLVHSFNFSESFLGSFERTNR